MFNKLKEFVFGLKEEEEIIVLIEMFEKLDQEVVNYGI